ncbi:MAG: protein-L-isoaspartate O-methyltransferase [Rhodobacteraceae bacterium]|nr:protein-L-isoaspartate O-methyltransferase [Paracoccaceae bacterium]
MTDFVTLRTAMVDGQVRPSDVTLYPVIEAMLHVPREDYVPEALREVAYIGDHLPLGGGRVVLDARVMAKMLESLAIQPDELVLDVGAGLGLSSALVAHLAEAVIALEEGETMAKEAEALLAAHDVDNAIVEVGALAAGAPRHGPYDVILIEGGVGEVPAALVEQLKLGGRMGAIMMDGALGRCMIGIKTASGMDWRWSFDATAPVVPGFEKQTIFAF